MGVLILLAVCGIIIVGIVALDRCFIRKEKP
jgi:hypothetical protein